MIRSLSIATLALMHLAGAQELPPVSGLPHAVALRRIAADDASDLVVALSSAHVCEPAPHPCWWNRSDRLGVLLVDRADPNRALPLAIEPGPNDDCSTRIERFTAQELVLSCTGQKFTTYDNQKFIYDVRARKLLNHFSYAPFSAARVLPGPKFVMSAAEKQLVADIDPATGDPRLTAAKPADAPDEADVTFGRFRLSRLKNRYGEEYPAIAGGGQVYPLAQSPSQPGQQPGPQPDPGEWNEQIGPHQIEGARFWFGKTFYDAEGVTGVGGFGYFDADTAAYRMFAPKEMAAWSVSAILVEPDCVWLALYHRGEYQNDAGGLLRWDRNTQTVRHWNMASIANSIARGRDGIYMGTTNGIAALRGDRVVSYFVDRSPAGQYRMAERN